MQLDTRVAIWNANGLSQHINEVEIFLKSHFIDIFLVSETHFNDKTYFKIRGYDLILANHPSNKAHAGAAILIRSGLKYETLHAIQTPEFQAAGIKLNAHSININIYSIYCPPRHNISCNEYCDFFSQLGSCFIVGGDFNAKHPWWGSRLTNPKGRELYKCITKRNFKTLTVASPTYWPSDPQRTPDLLDFVVYKGIHSNVLDICSLYELSSDHSPLLMCIKVKFESNRPRQHLITKNTNIKLFQKLLDSKVQLNTRLKTASDLDTSVETFNLILHECASLSTTQKPRHLTSSYNINISTEIRALIKEKRKTRRLWQNNRTKPLKTLLNKLSAKLKLMLKEFKNEATAEYLRNLDAGRNDEFKIWNATKYLKRPARRKIIIRNENGNWCRSDENIIEVFATHLEKTFSVPNNNHSGSNEIDEFINAPCQLDLPIKKISSTEVLAEIQKLNVKKSPGYDGIDGRMLRILSPRAISYLTVLFNSILRLDHFPSQWKCAEVIMILKPGKPENLATSYRPISLLPIFSKIFERILLCRMLPIVNKQNILPNHQFGFRQKHNTIEQCHHIYDTISEALERKQYCSAVFLDIEKAFDRVWHKGLLYKIKKLLPAPYFFMLKSYLNERAFFVRINNSLSSIRKIRAGVPQGSVLGPVLYTLFTSDLPEDANITLATYADDTAILASNECAIHAGRVTQMQLKSLEGWLEKWKISVNIEKCKHITFTLRIGQCPTVKLFDQNIPQTDCVTYLGMHMDRRLTWKDHVRVKRKQCDLKVRKMYWLLGRHSELSLENKLLLYKTIIKPVWTYGLQLWGTASNSNIEILQRFQNKTLRLITAAPWFITNNCIHRDLNMSTIKEEIKKYSNNYLNRLSNHTNVLAIILLDESNKIERLKRKHILELPY